MILTLPRAMVIAVAGKLTALLALGCTTPVSAGTVVGGSDLLVGFGVQAFVR